MITLTCTKTDGEIQTVDTGILYLETRFNKDGVMTIYYEQLEGDDTFPLSDSVVSVTLTKETS